MKTNVTCPNCGTELSVEIKKVNTTNKASERIEALRAAGVDVSNLFAIKGASGSEVLIRMVADVPQTVSDDDPIFAKIIKAGTIPDRRLFRRWVMAQMFRMLQPTPYSDGYVDAMHRKGYEYTWEMLVEELRVQAKLSRNDIENFNKRNVWFNKAVAVEMSKDYMVKLQAWFDGMKEKHCKGVPYKTVEGKDVFVADFRKKYVFPLYHLRYKIESARGAIDLHEAVALFNNARVKLPWGTDQCKAWEDAYKGAGAYFTLENLILFHGALLKDNRGRFMSKDASLYAVKAMAATYSATGKDGWRMLACLRKVIADNGIDIAAKRAEWAAKKRAKLY